MVRFPGWQTSLSTCTGQQRKLKKKTLISIQVLSGTQTHEPNRGVVSGHICSFRPKCPHCNGTVLFILSTDKHEVYATSELKLNEETKLIYFLDHAS